MRNCLYLWLAISLLLATAISCDKTMPSDPSTGKDGNESDIVARLFKMY